MWWTNSLCTLANEHLGTLAEYDPLTWIDCLEGSAADLLAGTLRFRYCDVSFGQKLPTWSLLEFGTLFCNAHNSASGMTLLVILSVWCGLQHQPLWVWFPLMVILLLLVLLVVSNKKVLIIETSITEVGGSVGDGGKAKRVRCTTKIHTVLGHPDDVALTKDFVGPRCA